uniref:Uncharacterized protein n=1 Tax=viral metagenome TaxID=1070528 RepID=A0A6H1ZA85_9ZZZZ
MFEKYLANKILFLKENIVDEEAFIKYHRADIIFWKERYIKYFEDKRLRRDTKEILTKIGEQLKKDRSPLL